MKRTPPASPRAWICLVSILGVSFPLPAEDSALPPSGGTPKEPVPPAEPAAEKTALPAGVLVRVNGRDVTADEYVNYLLASIGQSRLPEYVDRLLIDDEARRLAIQLGPQDVDAGVEEGIERDIRTLYQGKRALYEESLKRRRSSLESERSRRRQQLYYDTLADRIVLASRKSSEPEQQRLFAETYGEDGVDYVVAHILVSTRGQAAASPPAGAANSKVARRSAAEAKARAEGILAEIRSGLEFTEAAKKYSDDGFTRENDGRIPRYKKAFYGEAFHSAVKQLSTASPVSGVVESPRGFHLIRLIERKETKFEDVRAKLEETLRTQPPSARERQELRERLRSAAKIEGL